MTDQSDSPDTPVMAILADLRSTASSPSTRSDQVDDQVDPLLALLRPLPVGSDAAAAVDAITSEPPALSTTARRMRLLETVDRGLAARRADSGPIQAVLHRRRQASGMTLEQVAAAIATCTGAQEPASTHLANIESGATQLRADDEAVRLTAQWAVVIGLPRPVASEALRVSLRMTTSEPFIAAAGEVGPRNLDDAGEQIVALFESQYDATTATEEQR